MQHNSNRGAAVWKGTSLFLIIQDIKIVYAFKDFFGDHDEIMNDKYQNKYENNVSHMRSEWKLLKKFI